MSDYFSMNSSLEEILNNERVNKKLSYIFSPDYYENVKKPFRKMKLKNMIKFAKTPWGRPIPAQGLVDCANFLIERRQAGELISIPIWNGLPEDEEEKLEHVVLIPFLLKDKKNAPCVIICPGGAYARVSFHNEGFPVARKLNEKGYSVLILNYQTAPVRYPKPQLDLLRAIKFVRANHEKLGINAEDIMLMGFSAGGHLCASTALYYDSLIDETHRYDHISGRPDKLCLCYPVGSFVSDVHEESMLNLLGDSPSEELRRKLSPEAVVSKDFPKTYLWACTDDPVVNVNNTIEIGAALEEQGAEYKMALFLSGGHGIGLGHGTSAEGWLDEAVEYLKS